MALTQTPSKLSLLRGYPSSDTPSPISPINYSSSYSILQKPKSLISTKNKDKKTMRNSETDSPSSILPFRNGSSETEKLGRFKVKGMKIAGHRILPGLASLLFPLLLSVMFCPTFLCRFPAAEAASPPPPMAALEISFSESDLVFFDSNVTLTFNVTEDNGSPCRLCNVTCSVDGAPSVNCSSSSVSVSSLLEGAHNLTVTAGLLTETVVESSSFTVVLTEPTAVVTATSIGGPLAVNTTVTVNFTKTCSNFTCTGIDSCDIFVLGNGTVFPSSFTEVVPNKTYTVTVLLSNILEGYLRIGVSKGSCFDEWGQPFVNSNTSKARLKFNRNPVTSQVDWLTKSHQFTFEGKLYGGEVTNSTDELIVAVRFNSSLSNSVEEVKSALNVTGGYLNDTSGISVNGNRRYAFRVIPYKNPAVIEVSLRGEGLLNRYGMVPPNSVSKPVYYDERIFRVSLSTMATSRVKEELVGIRISFNSPVAAFPPSALTVTGGTVIRLEAASTILYVADISVPVGSSAAISVEAGALYNLVGSPNIVSNTIVTERYEVPHTSVVLSWIITGGVLGSVFSSGILSLAAAGLSLYPPVPGAALVLTPIPARNLLGLASHMQVFALSDWLDVPLPIKYRETIRGIRWMVPHVSLPWENRKPSIVLPVQYPTVNESTSRSAIKHYGRNLLTRVVVSPYGSKEGISDLAFWKRGGSRIGNEMTKSNVDRESFQQTFWEGTLTMENRDLGSKDVALVDDHFLANLLRTMVDKGEHEEGEHEDEAWGAEENEGGFEEERDGENEKKTFRGCSTLSRYSSDCFDNSMYDSNRVEGRRLLEAIPLTKELYLNIFANGSSVNGSVVKSVLGKQASSGDMWHSAGRSLFWVALVLGGLILLRAPIQLSLCRFSSHAPVSHPLYIPRLELFILLLAVPSICQAGAWLIRGGSIGGWVLGFVLLINVAAVLLYGIAGVLYFYLIQNEHASFKEPGNPSDVESNPLKIFGDRLGKCTDRRWESNEEKPSIIGRWGLLFETRQGIMEKSHPKRGTLQLMYIAAEITNRILLGLLVGFIAKSGGDNYGQVGALLALTVLLFSYLLIVRPFISRAVQFAEAISLFCEIGFYSCAFALMAQKDYRPLLEIILICLLFVSFGVQFLTLWFGFTRQILYLSSTSYNCSSFYYGFKAVFKGLAVLLPFCHPPPSQTDSKTGNSVTGSDAEKLDSAILVDNSGTPSKTQKGQLVGDREGREEEKKCVPLMFLSRLSSRKQKGVSVTTKEEAVSAKSKEEGEGSSSEGVVVAGMEEGRESRPTRTIYGKTTGSAEKEKESSGWGLSFLPKMTRSLSSAKDKEIVSGEAEKDAQNKDLENVSLDSPIPKGETSRSGEGARGQESGAPILKKSASGSSVVGSLFGTFSRVFTKSFSDSGRSESGLPTTVEGGGNTSDKKTTIDDKKVEVGAVKEEQKSRYVSSFPGFFRPYSSNRALYTQEFAKDQKVPVVVANTPEKKKVEEREEPNPLRESTASSMDSPSPPLELSPGHSSGPNPHNTKEEN